EKTFDVLIASGFARENWLALELKRRGYKICVVDLTPRFSYWAPEDIEGPFGIFQSRQNIPSQMARLADEEPLLNLPSGWVLWLKSGPVEMKGPLSKYQIEKLGMNESVTDYLRIADTKQDEDKSRLRDLMEHLPFNKTWLGQLSHQIASSVFAENRDSHHYSNALPLTAPFFIRRLTRRGLMHGAEKMRESGVEVFQPTEVKLELEGNSLKSMTCAGVKIKAQNWVWLFSSIESEFLFPELANQLFPTGALWPKWQWMRYRLKIGENPIANELPDYFTMIKDVYLPWTHDNLALFLRTNRKEDFDFWIRLPQSQRFSNDYVQSMGSRVLEELKSRLPGVNVQISDWPQETNYSEREIGPSLYPVYDPAERRKFKGSAISNIQFGGPEYWSALNWGGRFRHHEKILNKVESQMANLRARKDEAKGDQSIYPI
ncbi:MAG: hypothetical protein KDD25_08115, partial [Bdellovibrionales bacterium]|nr:hypothetical protein [Bdellovibrionales bacterium]